MRHLSYLGLLAGCLLGTAPLELAKADYEQRLRTWEAWQPVAELAQG